MWSEPALSSILPSSRKVRASVAPKWAWKQPTQVEEDIDHTLISPDTEPEQSMEDEEKQRLRTECLCPQSDCGKIKYFNYILFNCIFFFIK